MRIESSATDDASILIVDDEPSSIHVVRRALAEYSDVRFALSGPDALRLARERAPDLILLDGDIPGEDGFEVCRKLKADEALRDIAVIFVTAHHDIEFESRALALGAADFIPKPVSPPRVQLRVRLHLQLKAQLDQLSKLATTDALTGLANRRALDLALVREWHSLRRTGGSLSLMLVDVDHFKQFNDTYGHPAGDECLRQVARAVASAAKRPNDLATRFGGEEFAVILSDTAAAGALHVGRVLNAAVQGAAILHVASPVAPVVTVSIGIASVEASGSAGDDMARSSARAGSSPANGERQLIEAADRALYEAKRNGRNRVELGGLELPGAMARAG